MISVTGIGLSRARFADRFSASSRFARRTFLDRSGRPFRMFRTSTRDRSSFVGVARDASGLEDELLLVPVIVVDVRAVEALDHFGGAGAGFDGLVDAEGDLGATTFIVQAVRVDDDGGSPARGSLPGGLAAPLVRALALFRERLIPAHRDVFDQTSFSGRSLRTCLS